MLPVFKCEACSSTGAVLTPELQLPNISTDMTSTGTGGQNTKKKDTHVLRGMAAECCRSVSVSVTMRAGSDITLTSCPEHHPKTVLS